MEGCERIKSTTKDSHVHLNPSSATVTPNTEGYSCTLTSLLDGNASSSSLSLFSAPSLATHMHAPP